MRTRNSLTVVLSVLVAVLVATIIALVTGSRPDAYAGGGGQAPTTADPTAAGPGSGSTVNRGGNGGGTNHRGTVTRPNRTTAKPPPTIRVTPTRTKSNPPRTPIPPRLGAASVPRGAAYNVSGDRQAFTMVFSTLEAGTDAYPASKSLSTTVPVTGDTQNAVLELGVSGYVFTDESTTAKLKITANGRTMTRSFRTGMDDDFVQSFSVPLRGARQCTVTLKLEVNPNPAVREPTGIVSVPTLDGQFI